MDTATFQLLYPEFDAINANPAQVTVIVGIFLADADAFTSDCAFGTLRDKAVGLLTAHRLALKFPLTGVINQNIPGVINSQGASTSGLNIGVATSGMVTGDVPYRADYARTNYGLELLTLIDAAVAPAAVAGQGNADAQGGGWSGAPCLPVGQVLPII